LRENEVDFSIRRLGECRFLSPLSGVRFTRDDPSYTIRSVPANPHDSALCLLLGHSAVHAGMSGRTNIVVGFWNHQFTHVPIVLAASQRKKMEPEGILWNSVLASTGQPWDMR